MGGRVEGQACEDPGARTHIGTSGNFIKLHTQASCNLKPYTGETMLGPYGPGISLKSHLHELSTS